MRHKALKDKLCFTFLIGCGFALFCLVGIFSVVHAEGQPESAPTPQPQNNDVCLGCHNNPKMEMMFPNGEQLSAAVDKTAYEQSVHGQLECSSCHPGYESYPHPKTEAQNLREYSLSFHDSCQKCHPNQFEMVAGSVHEELLQAGNQDTPTCADCHQPHQQVRLSQLGDNPSAHYADSPQICATCHQEAYDAYVASIHGEQLLAGNPDMPTCIDCHSVHGIYNPREGKFRKDSIDMCAKCHADSSIMGKYGLATNVLDTYVVFHDTTVSLLEEYDPNSISNKPACYDCHGIHNVGEFTPPPLALTMPGADQYAPIVAEASPIPTGRVGFTSTIVGLLLGSVGTLTITQLLKERKREEETKDNGDQS